jgi:nitrite reductase (NADH) small subunit
MLSAVPAPGQSAPSEREAAGEEGGAPWVDVCALEDILPNTGVCALLGGKQVAIFRVGESAVHALSNFDPFSKAFVLSRGIVGDRNGVPKVASPIFKQSFELPSGRCLDDPAVSLAVYPVRLRGGRIEVSPRPRLDRQEP